MKNIFTLIVALFFASSFAHAQITLDNTDFPTVGLSVELINGDADGSVFLTDSITISPSGASFSHDFTDITSYIIDTTTIDYVAPSSTGWSASHPTANISAFVRFDTSGTDTVSKVYDHYKTDFNTVELTGQTYLMDLAWLGGGSPSGSLDTLHVVFDPIDTIVDVAFSLGYSEMDTFYWWGVINAGFGITHTEFGVQDVDVDGYGGLTLPNGTFSVLRERNLEYRTIVDSSFGAEDGRETDTTLVYRYWVKEVGHPLLSIEMDPTFVYVVEFTYANVFGPLSANSIPRDQFKLYPNPATEHLNLTFPTPVNEPLKLNLLNTLGQTLREKVIQLGEASTQISLDGLTPGVYLAIVQNRQGDNVISERIIVR